jgi:hypothetical protein
MYVEEGKNIISCKFVFETQVASVVHYLLTHWEFFNGGRKIWPQATSLSLRFKLNWGENLW